MKQHVSNALQALEARRATRHEWSRLERHLTGSVNQTARLDLEAGFDRLPEQDSSEMRLFLAAQTAQTV